MNPVPSNRPVIYFDGVCNLCNSTVQFIIKHDKKKQFLFAPLQSAAGAVALAAIKQQGVKGESVILYYKNRYYTKSAAALHTFKLLGGLWAIFFTAIVIPPFIRNAVYGFISRNRYKWFGKKDACMLPTPELKSRFIS